jgi:hypothetical protein
MTGRRRWEVIASTVGEFAWAGSGPDHLNAFVCTTRPTRDAPQTMIIGGMACNGSRGKRDQKATNPQSRAVVAWLYEYFHIPISRHCASLSGF